MIAIEEKKAKKLTGFTAYFVINIAWIITIIIIVYAPWVLLLLGALFGINIKIGSTEVGLNGLIPSVKNFIKVEKEHRRVRKEFMNFRKKRADEINGRV